MDATTKNIVNGKAHTPCAWLGQQQLKRRRGGVTAFAAPNGRLALVCYESPELEMIKLGAEDIITTSPGTETTPKDNTDGIWDLDVS